MIREKASKPKRRRSERLPKYHDLSLGGPAQDVISLAVFPVCSQHQTSNKCIPLVNTNKFPLPFFITNMKPKKCFGVH